MKHALSIVPLLLAGVACSTTTPRSTALPPPPEFREHYMRQQPHPLAASEGRTRIAPQQEIFFSLDSAVLTTDARDDLDAVAAWLRGHPDERVVIEGRSDPAGSADYNLALSARRAEAVKQHLYARGVDRDRIDVVALGEVDPIAAPDPVNRKVVVYVATGASPVASLDYISFALTSPPMSTPR